MECDQCFPSEPFVMPIVGQFLGAVSCFVVQAISVFLLSRL